jgi:hypothetical protein
LKISQGIYIRHCGDIQTAIISTKSPATIGFQNHVERPALRGGRSLIILNFSKSFFCWSHLVCGKAEWFGRKCWADGLNEMRGGMLGLEEHRLSEGSMMCEEKRKRKKRGENQNSCISIILQKM